MWIKVSPMLWAAIGAALWVAGCATTPQDLSEKKYADGEMHVPENYKTWTKKFDALQRPEIKQVREVYVNSVGAQATAGGPLPNGYVSVMEIWSVQTNQDTTLKLDANGKLIKDKLQKIFVMAKGEGWGEGVKPVGLRNGDWVYSAWRPDGHTAAPDLAASCRGCHLGLADKDYMPRYDEYYKSVVR